MSAGDQLQRRQDGLAAVLRAVASAPGLEVRFGGDPGLDAAGARLPEMHRLPSGRDWNDWRVLTNRLAARYRHPPPLRRMLGQPARQAVFESLWQARAEALLARVLPGVERSLAEWSAGPGGHQAPSAEAIPLPERVHLLAHTVFGTCALPAPLYDQLLEWATRHCVPRQALAETMQNARAYAAVALRVARRLCPRDQPARTPDEPPRRRPRARQPAGGDAHQGRRRRPSRSMPATAAGNVAVDVGCSDGYRVHTRAYDETLRPRDLADARELAALRRRLEEATPETARLVARLARRLERRLGTYQPRRWREADLGESLDPRRLARVIAEPLGSGAYRERARTLGRDTVVTLLVDNSASMRGRRILMAALCADLLARSLERCGVATEILGFTTSSWDGGPAAAAWRAAGCPAHPGRLNGRRHIVYKAADHPWRRARSGLGLMLREELLKENLDGEALSWAASRLARRPERRRIVIVIGDGAPRDRATALANGAGYLEAHLKSVIAELQRSPTVEVLAVGIGQSVQELYPQSVVVRDVDELAAALTDQLAAALARPGGR